MAKHDMVAIHCDLIFKTRLRMAAEDAGVTLGAWCRAVLDDRMDELGIPDVPELPPSVKTKYGINREPHKQDHPNTRRKVPREYDRRWRRYDRRLKPEPPRAE